MSGLSPASTDAPEAIQAMARQPYEIDVPLLSILTPTAVPHFTGSWRIGQDRRRPRLGVLQDSRSSGQVSSGSLAVTGTPGLIHSDLFIAYFRLARHPETTGREHIARLASTDQVGLPPSGCLEAWAWARLASLVRRAVIARNG